MHNLLPIHDNANNAVALCAKVRYFGEHEPVEHELVIRCNVFKFLE